MSLVYTEITLTNAVDAANAVTGIVKEPEVRRTTVRALVDSGAWTLVIDDATRKSLGLRTVKAEPCTLADGTKSAYELVGPLEVRWKDRSVNCDAIVIPNANEILLGAIPLEAMDLTINPRREELVGAHGDQIVHTLKTLCQ